MCICNPEIRTPICKNCLPSRSEAIEIKMDKLLLSLTDEEREVLAKKLSDKSIS